MGLADRYLPEDGVSILRDLERRLRALELRPDASPQAVPLTRVDAGAYVITSATWTAAYRGYVDEVAQPALRLRVQVSAVTGPGDVRVRMGAQISPTQTVSAGTTATLVFDWLHGHAYGGPQEIVVEASAPAGGSVEVYAPTSVVLAGASTNST